MDKERSDVKIEVGKSYRTRDGRKAHVTDKGIGSTFFYHALINGSGYTYTVEGNFGIDRVSNLDLVAEWVDEPKTWGEMTPEEKGALLLAAHEHRPVEFLGRYESAGKWLSMGRGDTYFVDDYCYRVKTELEPEGKQVTLEGRYYPSCSEWFFDHGETIGATHKITFNLVDGEPDCGSIKMEKIRSNKERSDDA